jgi:hypothetical protein
MGRRRRNSVVPFVVLGAAVSIGVVALTASRFGWRRTKTEPASELPETVETPETPQTPDAPAQDPRFKPAPPRPANAPRWDSPPADYAKSGRASP